MARLVVNRSGTLKAKSSNSNSMFTIPGVSVVVVGIGDNAWDTDAIVDAANFLLAIGGKEAVEDSNLKFETSYNEVS